ncbi:MAG: YfiR family protein [Candidatus Aminicenantes bacterium]|nr:YfiR family protein [Candidatus Aminicenantes bacterium]
MKRALGLFLAAFGLASAGSPQGPARVPCYIQYDLTVKILAFDRRLPARVGEELVLGIVFQGDFPASLQVMTEMEQAYKISPVKKVGAIPVRTAAVDIGRSPRWEEELKMAGVDIVYLAPLKEPAFNRMIALCRRLRLTTIASLPEYPFRGAAVGFEPSGEKPVIVINLSAARAEGADFSSRLLGMAKVIR